MGARSQRMVSLVIVSHSAKLAEGVAEMAREMAGPDVRLAATGGLELPGRPLGTDAQLILRAIEQVYSDEGVVVLLDLGSAVMSAEMAIDQLPAERRARVFISEAPLVEGALAAAVQARLGSPVAQVLAEARGALAAKGVEAPSAPTALGEPGTPLSRAPAAATELSLQLMVQNRLGLHSRPAARFVQIAAQFAQAEVQLWNLTADRGPVSAKRINAGATQGVQESHKNRIPAPAAKAGAAFARPQRH